jgi:hypothetical protein
MTRIDTTFAALRATGGKAFVAYIMAGDPDLETSFQIMRGLPDAGVDIIELGVPFTDPMADGPTIQLAGQRALDGGQTLVKTLDMVRRFRAQNTTTPIVLMGYYNPIYSRGVDRFLTEAVEAGIDGLIVVDLPPEEDSELCLPAQAAGLNFIRLATPYDRCRAPAQGAAKHVRFRLLCVDHRDHGRGGRAGGPSRPRSGTDQGVHRFAGDCGLWHFDPRHRTRYCRCRGWLRCGVGDCKRYRRRQTGGRGAGLCPHAGRRGAFGRQIGAKQPSKRKTVAPAQAVRPFSM